MENKSIIHVTPARFEWTVERMCQFLKSTPSGRAALDYYLSDQDKLRIWKAEYIRQQYKEKGAPAWETYSLYGYTEFPGENGVVDITISADIIEDDFTAAATFVHEIEHARGLLTGKGGSEIDARQADMQFYVEAKALALLPQEYFDKGIVHRKDGKLEVDYARLAAEAKKWGEGDDQYAYGDLLYGKYVPLPLEEIHSSAS